MVEKKSKEEYQQAGREIYDKGRCGGIWWRMPCSSKRWLPHICHSGDRPIPHCIGTEDPSPSAFQVFFGSRRRL